MRITLRQLAIFQAVYRQGSTQAAAEQVSLTQSAVSMALSALEKQLGTQLFDRIGRHLVPNQQAEILLPQAEEVLLRCVNIEQMFTGVYGRLKIGASQTIGNYLLPGLIQRFKQLHPQTDIALFIHNSKEICEGLLNFDFDFGFVEGPNHLPAIKSTPWIEDEMVLFCAAHSQLRGLEHDQDTLDFEDLGRLPMIVREVGSGTREILDQFLLQYVEHPQVVELSNSEAIKQSVVHDMGVGCLSLYTLQDLLDMQKIRILRVNKLRPMIRKFCFIESPHKFVSPIQAEFMQFCMNSRQDLRLDSLSAMAQ
ncbi:LysR substrate-binding domain-containing protein [Brackiella oedipodis]|uniref:LysR substrate-binding domain-containing protein n=1 Tax=Brackiella oedipodis TaxID=124225 RepID=UPI0006849DAE|nr:LysR substrate-binding domain-containing protein [Brackiella oedipodis]